MASDRKIGDVMLVQHGDTKGKNKLDEFAEGTTMHGFRYAFGSSYNTRRRLAWMLVILLMICGFFITFVKLMVQYYKYESAVNIKANRFHELELPSISLCNANVAKHGAMTDFSSEYAKSLISVTGILGSLPIPYIPAPEIAKTISWKEFHQDFGHSVNETFVSCYFGDHINCTEFVTKLSGDKLFCLTFNSQQVIQRRGNLTVKQSGHLYGLTIFLDARTQDYGHPLFLGEGMELEVHSPEKIPFTEGQSQFISPGKEFFLAINKKVVKRLPKPYSSVDCIYDEDNAEALKKYNLSRKFDTYSYSSCIFTCKIAIAEKCGCSLAGDSLPMCSMYTFQSCVVHELADFYESGEDCGCLPSCTNTLYESQLTSMDFPNAVMEEFLPDLDWSVDSVEEMKKRYIELHVYFSTLGVKEEEQIPLIGLAQLFSNFGGQMGLYMGASIITVLEFLDVTLCMICDKCKRRKRIQEAQKQEELHKKENTATKMRLETF